ncbi:MAG: type II toxin-antitoxin system VapC family toxin [Pseudohongiella sp.]|uniref:type II toxin-antitoxin system VapC family toxin n=1 Tax=Pseudohongiella sp. TaxID=1979412 RepID=UPI0034A0600F
MSYLVDTNVLSELRRKAPAKTVVDWFSQRPAGVLYISVLTLGEIRKGVESLAVGECKAALQDWLEIDLPAFFAGRILNIDTAVAQRWGVLIADARRPLPVIDSLLAATALAHNLTVVTRNTADFDGLPVPIVNPWA